MIFAVALMFRFSFGLEREAQTIEAAIGQVIRDGVATKDIWTPGKVLLGTEEIGEAVCEKVKRLKN